MNENIRSINRSALTQRQNNKKKKRRLSVDGTFAKHRHEDHLSHIVHAQIMYMSQKCRRKTKNKKKDYRKKRGANERKGAARKKRSRTYCQHNSLPYYFLGCPSTESYPAPSHPKCLNDVIITIAVPGRGNEKNKVKPKCFSDPGICIMNRV